MQVTVKLFATFRQGRFSIMTRKCASGASIADVARELAIPETDLSIIVLNGRRVELQEKLNDGDQLSLFPMVGGG
jgi:molybdopterin converting factor small subunit